MSLFAHHVVIAGFRQHRGNLAGVDHALVRLDKFRRPGVRVELFGWDHDWEREARFVERHAPKNWMPVVCVYAYSWGFGWGAMQFAEALAQLERPVKLYGLVGCDGVYRHGYRCGNWRAFWPGSTIRLPWNVERHCVRAFHQTGSLPRGHKIVDCCGREVPRELIEDIPTGEGLTTPATHLNVDESPTWLDACEKLAQRAAAIVDRRQPWKPSYRGNLTVFNPAEE